MYTKTYRLVKKSDRLLHRLGNSEQLGTSQAAMTPLEANVQTT